MKTLTYNNKVLKDLKGIVLLIVVKNSSAQINGSESVPSLWTSLEILALRNREVNSLEASPVPVSIFIVQSLIGQEGVYVWKLMLCHKVPLCHLSPSVEPSCSPTTPCQSISKNAEHNLGLSLLSFTDSYTANMMEMLLKKRNENLFEVKKILFFFFRVVHLRSYMQCDEVN